MCLQLISLTKVEITGPDNGGRVCAVTLGECCAQVCTANDCVSGITAKISYTRDSSRRHAANKVIETRDETWQAPPGVGATPTLLELPGPVGSLTIRDASEPGQTLAIGDVTEPGGMLELQNASESTGTDDLVSAPNIPLPLLEDN